MIRKANNEDILRLIEFERYYMLEHEPQHIEKWESNVDKTRNFLIDLLDNIVVAEADTDLIGYAYWSLSEGKPCVYSIYVIESFRRRGVANLLMKALETDVIQKGYDEINLQTLIDNPAQYTFNKLGYTTNHNKNGYLQYSKKL